MSITSVSSRTLPSTSGGDLHPLDIARQRRAANVIFAHLCFVASVIILYVWVRPFAGWSDGALLFAASVALLLELIWSLISWRLVTESVFDPYGIFIVAAMIFNAGCAYLYLAGLNTTGLMILDFSFPADVTLQTLLLIFLSLSAFHFGALVRAATRRRPLFPDRRAIPLGSLAPEVIRFVGWALILVSALPTALQLKQAISVVRTAGYFGLYQQDYATGLQAGTQFLSSFIVPGALVLLAGSRDARRGRIVSGIVIAIYALIQLFLGARYPAIAPVIAYALLWHHVVRPLPRMLVIGVAIFVFGVVLPMVGATRDKPVSDPTDPVPTSSRKDSSFTGVFVETESTTATIAYTLTLVPAVRPFDHGTQYFFAASTLVPNLFWTLHPATQHGLAGDWVTWIVDPGFAASGGSLGYSFIAEAYLNWGWIGGPIFLGIVGFFFAQLVYWGCSTADPARLAVVASFLTFVVFWARGESINIVRPLVWYSLVPYLMILFVAYMDRRGMGPMGLWNRVRGKREQAV
ncbi:MAG: O-antigen polysaccharide polymerase Wzy [Thermomicrobiales bacterium]